MSHQHAGQHEPLYFRITNTLCALRLHGIRGTRGFEQLETHGLAQDQTFVLNVSDQMPAKVQQYLSSIGVPMMEFCQGSGYWTLEKLLQACMQVDKWLSTDSQHRAVVSFYPADFHLAAVLIACCMTYKDAELTAVEALSDFRAAYAAVSHGPGAYLVITWAAINRCMAVLCRRRIFAGGSGQFDSRRHRQSAWRGPAAAESKYGDGRSG